MRPTYGTTQHLRNRALYVCVCNALAVSGRMSHWHKLLAWYLGLLTGENICVYWRLRIFDASDLQRQAETTERQRKPLDEINENTKRKTHDHWMGKAWRCVTLEKASSLLLPWQWSLLGNCVAMARVSSVMQTWPHPPTSSPAVKSREALLLAKCLCFDQRSSVCGFVSSCFFCLHCGVFFGVFFPDYQF